MFNSVNSVIFKQLPSNFKCMFLPTGPVSGASALLGGLITLL